MLVCVLHPALAVLKPLAPLGLWEALSTRLLFSGARAGAPNKPCALPATEGTSGARTEVAQLIPVDGCGLGLRDGDLAVY